MAVRHGYTIVPVATVGTEDVVRPVMDVPIREVLTAGGKLGSMRRMKKFQTFVKPERVFLCLLVQGY